METKILSNQVICNKCNDAPYSSHQHDFRPCKCGSIAVDGGTAYLRRVGDISAYKDISIEWPLEKYNDLSSALNDAWVAGDAEEIANVYMDREHLPDHFFPALVKAAQWALGTNRNMFGLICALTRTERDGDFYK